MSTEGQPDGRLLRLSAALLVEQEIRSKRRLSELAQALVNGTARVHCQDSAFLFLPRGRHWRLAAAMGVTQPDRTAPLPRWLERLCNRLMRSRRNSTVSVVEPEELAVPPDDWAGGLPRHWLWLSLYSPAGQITGVLALARQTAWQKHEQLLAEPLTGCYGHALWALRRRSWAVSVPMFVKMAMAAAALSALSLVTVRLDTMAPAEVAPAHPVTLAAPFDGVVAEILVRPYQSVRAGDLLAVLDPRDLEAERNLALKTLAVAETELNSYRNQAFVDQASKAQLAIAQQKVLLQKEILAHAEDRLARHRIVAPEDGVVLFDDRFSWKGRPVVTGQAIVSLAQTNDVELRIDLPVAALIPMQVGAEVRLFLDMAPTSSVAAYLSRLAYDARPIPGNGLAYRYVAEFPADGEPVQLGARGVAKIYGPEVSLGYYVFRRPMAKLRQFLGI